MSTQPTAPIAPNASTASIAPVFGNSTPIPTTTRPKVTFPYVAPTPTVARTSTINPLSVTFSPSNMQMPNMPNNNSSSDFLKNLPVKSTTSDSGLSTGTIIGIIIASIIIIGGLIYYFMFMPKPIVTVPSTLVDVKTAIKKGGVYKLIYIGD